uniref:Glycosyl hydrolase family 13 catalytic domain-containing protein n=2 Tax=Compsopogon caeruleus TaxID=31354 RepID=A0A7S1TFZ9_9RHOD|mmetsp:Transcript_5258/g.10741  ORF Transcript_5258/g.10741 Transcript_5258/m.10741 type:complete len:607 (+) Transcript_5258:124-1944(+)
MSRGADGSTWITSVVVPPHENLHQMEYKYLVGTKRQHRRDRIRNVLWLPGENRKLDVPPIVVEAYDPEWILDRVTQDSEKKRQAHWTIEQSARNIGNTTSDITDLDSYHRSVPVPSVNIDLHRELRETPPVSNDVPEWYREAIFYHIYPLGTPGHGGGGFFGDVPERNDGYSDPIPRILELRAFYQHFHELGINAIYFSPMFESTSHGYDTSNFFEIDRRVGSLASFKVILAELHERGIRVCLDGVFNHTGRDHFAFQELLSAGDNWRSNPYREWYLIRRGSNQFGDPFRYECWEGHQQLPRLNLDNPAVREHLFSAARFWLGEVGIDGWRLDVAHEIPTEFWVEFRKVCYSVRPDHVLIGELIHGDYNKWVGPKAGRLHSGTNYQLSKPIWSSLKDKNFFEFAHSLRYELQVYDDLCLLNFVSNHDVSRVASQLNDPSLVMLAYVLVFCTRGVPCVYYGDETGMRGNKNDGDAALRRRMPRSQSEWEDPSGTICTAIASLAQLRKSWKTLAHGAMRCIQNTNEQLVIVRYDDNEFIVVALNCSSSGYTYCAPLQELFPHLSAGAALTEIWSSRCEEKLGDVTYDGAAIRFDLPALSACCLRGPRK